NNYPVSLAAHSTIFINLGPISTPPNVHFDLTGSDVPGSAQTVVNPGHHLAFAGGSDTLTLDLSSAVTAQDGDGDTVALHGQLNITVNDDAPTAINATVELSEVFEDGLLTGNPEGAPGSQPTVATVTFADLSALVHAGADTPVTFGFNLLKDGTAAGLSSDGSAISYQIAG